MELVEKYIVQIQNQQVVIFVDREHQVILYSPLIDDGHETVFEVMVDMIQIVLLHDQIILLVKIF